MRPRTFGGEDERFFEGRGEELRRGPSALFTARQGSSSDGSPPNVPIAPIRRAMRPTADGRDEQPCGAPTPRRRLLTAHSTRRVSAPFRARRAHAERVLRALRAFVRLLLRCELIRLELQASLPRIISSNISILQTQAP